MAAHTHVLLALFTAFAAARLFGHSFQRLKLPPVVGELLAGAVLGRQFIDLSPAGADDGETPRS